MCIRDSTWENGYPDRYLDAVKAMKVNDRIAIKTVSTQRKNCLLYTSDAADERSSVDLGGRRIIKKKNRQWYGRHDIVAENTQNDYMK
mgnify:CR=1 FL=1